MRFTDPRTGSIYALDHIQSARMSLVEKSPSTTSWEHEPTEELGRRLKFVPPMQLAAFMEQLKTGGPCGIEEITEQYTRLADIWDKMPTVEDGDAPSVSHLRFFNCAGAGTWHMFNKPTDNNPRAFGHSNLGDDEMAELGDFLFFSVPEWPGAAIMDLPMLNIDLYHTPQPWK